MCPSPGAKINGGKMQKKKTSNLWKMIFLSIISVIAFTLTSYFIVSYLRKEAKRTLPPEDIVTTTPNVKSISFEKLYDTSMGFIKEKKNILVSDQKSLEDLWKEITPTGGDNPLPKVDFAKEIVAVVALGEYSNCKTLDINQIYEKEGKDIVQFTVTGVKDGCACTLNISYPVEVVKFTKTSDSIEFEEKSASLDCK